MSVLLPTSTPEHKVRPLIRRMVVNALAATGEWPVRVRIVSNHRSGTVGMKRWFIEYEIGPHGEIRDDPSFFDDGGHP